MTLYIVYKTRILPDTAAIVYFDSAHPTQEQAEARQEELFEQGYYVTWDVCPFNYKDLLR